VGVLRWLFDEDHNWNREDAKKTKIFFDAGTAESCLKFMAEDKDTGCTYKTIVDGPSIAFSDHGTAALVLSDANRMPLCSSMRDQYTKRKTEYYLASNQGPGFGLMRRTIQLTYWKFFFFGIIQTTLFLNLQILWTYVQVSSDTDTVGLVTSYHKLSCFFVIIRVKCFKQHG